MQIDLIGQPVMNAAPAKADKTDKASPRKKQGTIYVSNGGWRYEEPTYTPEALKKYAESYYGSSLILKLSNLIVSGAPELKAIKPDGQEDKDLSKLFMAISEKPSIRLFEKMRFALYDIVWAGFCAFNDVWDYEGSEYSLTALRRLPPEGFNQSEGTADYIDPIFRGICVVNDSLQFWQTDDFKSIQIIDPFYVQAPLSRDIAGTPMIKPLIPVIVFIQQALGAMQQTVGRMGAPWLFVRVGPEYSDADLAYLDKLLANYGKDTAFKLLPNMEIVNHNMPEPQTPIEAVNLLARMLIEYFSPASFIQNDNAMLSASDAGALRLFNQWVIGMQNHIEDAFERLMQRYLDGNLYKGYHVEITLPRPVEDKTEMLLKVLDGVKKADIATDAEMRNILPEYLPELTEEEMARFQEEKKNRQPAQGQPLMNAASADRVVQHLQESLKA